MPLERFRRAKAEELRALCRNGIPPAFAGTRPSFGAALRRGAAGPAGLAVIAEYKRRSPSRGLICERIEAEEAAIQYAAAGASCLSVLTEERFFGGSLAYIDRAASALARMATEGDCGGAGDIPLLRKDFIFDPAQVAATAATRASALLLIVRLTPDAALLRALREQAEAAGMEAVVEVFDEHDLTLARESGARIIQVNARDLGTLCVDRDVCLRLARRHAPLAGEVWIAASGMGAPEHLAAAREAGFTAALVGSALMEAGRPGAALQALLAGTADLRTASDREERPCF